MGRALRPVLAVLVLVGIAAAVRQPLASQLRRLRRGPARIARANDVARIVIDSASPTGAVRLLWLAGRRASTVGDHVLVEDGGGGVLEVAPSLEGKDASAALAGLPAASVAAAPDGSTWIVDGHDRIHQFARNGAEIRTLVSSIPVPVLTIDAVTNTVWLVRSSTNFTYRMPGERSPLFERLSIHDSVFRPVGVASVPEHSLLADLQNSGHLIARGDTVWFAPFIRDEVIAMTGSGDTLWRAVRHLPHTTTEPRFELVDGHATVDYHAVNMGLVLEPNGRLLVLSTPDGMPESGRIDELDPTSGRLLATAELPSALPTLAAARDGRIYLVDPTRVLPMGGTSPTPLPTFDLPMIDGARLNSSDLRGTPTLLNFWATWCGPCRRELPAVDSLRRDLAASGVRVIGMNDDRDSVAAGAFLTKLVPGMPSTLGGGRLQEMFGYLGLPWTLLLDRDGRVVRRWTGELSAKDYREIRLSVALQLRSAPAPMMQHGPMAAAHHVPTTR